MVKQYTVAYYEIDRAYGGPEEGGWWYDCGVFQRLSRTFTNEEAAYKWARRANSLLNVLQRDKRSVDSVLYSGGRYAAEVYEGLPPHHYPESKPYYE